MSASRRGRIGVGRRAWWRPGGWAAVALVVAATAPALAAPAQAVECARGDRECAVDEYLDQVRFDPARLRDFVAELPKGGDLHNHLHGAVAMESLIRYAAEDGRCIDTTSLAASPGPCTAGQRPARDAETDPGFRDDVLRAWSMQGFDPSGPESGHDHFFATFGKFGAATDGRDGDMLAEVARDAHRQHESYVETMFSKQSGAVQDLVRRKGFDPSDEQEFAALRRALLPELGPIVRAAKQDTDRDFARYRRLLRCGTAHADPACGVRLAIDFQVGRAKPPATVFANLLLGFELAQQDGRFVGVNLVQPEDDPVSLRDYTLHMRMVGFLRSLYPTTHVTLHAGELLPGFAKPDDLSFHINQAVDIAETDRVGHGVDLRHEDDWQALTDRMRTKPVLVEAPLTSNCQILRACDPQDHPLLTYLERGVPVALATDDPGVSRSDITTEYQRAAAVFGLSYSQLKASTRNSLEHAFLPGASLWSDPVAHRPAEPCAGQTPGQRAPGARCTEFLRDNPKADLQWRHEAALNRFETDIAARTGHA